MEQIKLNYKLDISEKSSWLTVTATPAVRSSFAYVQELGDFYCGPDYFTERENLPSYLIKFTIGGEGTLEYNNNVYSVKPGSLFWIDCRKPQLYYTSRSVSHWHVIWVHLYGPTAGSYYEAFLEQNMGSPVISCTSEAGFIELFNDLIRIYSASSTTVQDDIAASSLLTRLMADCIRETRQDSESYRSSDYAVSIRNYISSHYSENISLDALAQVFSINKYYLQKVFKRSIGLSPNEYLTRTRLEKAKTLLRTTNAPMIQIAQEVGYTPSYFDNVFKKYEGISPQRYRQSWYDSENSSKNIFRNR